MDKTITTHPIVLPKEYWITFGKQEIKNSVSKKESVNNVTALIVSVLTETFPELAKSSDGKFISFQDKVSKIISKLN